MSIEINNQAAQAPSSNTVAFNLEQYLSGEYELMTRNGLVVVHLTINSLNAVIENADGDHFLQNYQTNGFANKGVEENDLDLIMLKLEKDNK